MNLYELTGELLDAMDRLQIDEETGENRENRLKVHLAQSMTAVGKEKQTQ